MNDRIWATVDTWVEARRQRAGTPGLQLAVTDRHGLLHETAFGVAHLESGAPMRTDHLLETGSIGKSFTALALLQLAENGEIDLHAPVTAYLPWFDIQTEYEPITLHHLLTHSAGITAGVDFAPAATYQVWALRESGTSTPPGTRFRYSNIGYKVLGLVLQAVTGKSYAENIQQRVLDPLGLHASVPIITNAVRPRMATGYTPLLDDRPWWPGRPLAPATWLETDTGDGCLVQTAGELAGYLRMLMNRGAGPNGRLLSGESFARFSGRAMPVDDESLWYGYGLFHREVRGHHYLSHPGGMVGYAAGMLADMDLGLGVTVLVNGPGAPNGIARAVLDYLRTNAEGEQATLPGPPAPAPVAPFAGRYLPLSAGDRPIQFTIEGDRLLLREEHGARTLTEIDEGQYATAEEPWARFPFVFERDGDRVTGLTHGPHQWFASDCRRPEVPDLPAGWFAFPGHYRSHSPWMTGFRVFERAGRLWLSLTESTDGLEAEQALVEVGPDRFRAGDDPRIPEWISFDTIVDGLAQRATIASAHFYRVDAP